MPLDIGFSRIVRRWFWILPWLTIVICPLLIFTSIHTSRRADSKVVFEEVTYDDPVQSLDPRPALVQPNPEACFNRRLFVGVHTRADAYDIRQEWRESFGRLQDTYNFCLVFAVGKPAGSSKRLHQEALHHEDLLIGDFTDTYHNLTHKNLMLLSYFSQELSEVPFFLKLDDDVAVNLEKLHKFIARESRSPFTVEVTSPGPKIWCLLWNNALVDRLAIYKHAVSRRTWKFSTWPNYCSGMAYITTQTAASALLSALPHENWLFIDDVFVTGVLAKRARIKHVQIKPLVNYKANNVSSFLDGKIMFQLTLRNQTQNIFKRVNKFE